MNKTDLSNCPVRSAHDHTSKSTSWPEIGIIIVPIMQKTNQYPRGLCCELKNSFDGIAVMPIWVCVNSFQKCVPFRLYLNVVVFPSPPHLINEFTDAGAVCAVHTAWTIARMETIRVQIATHMLAHTKIKCQTQYTKSSTLDAV